MVASSVAGFGHNRGRHCVDDPYREPAGDAGIQYPNELKQLVRYPDACLRIARPQIEHQQPADLLNFEDRVFHHIRRQTKSNAFFMRVMVRRMRAMHHLGQPLQPLVMVRRSWRRRVIGLGILCRRNVHCRSAGASAQKSTEPEAVGRAMLGTDGTSCRWSLGHRKRQKAEIGIDTPAAHACPTECSSPDALESSPAARESNANRISAASSSSPSSRRASSKSRSS